MRAIEDEGEATMVELSRHELIILSNAVNEVCHGPDAIEEWEFRTRMGASRQEAEALLTAIGELLRCQDA